MHPRIVLVTQRLLSQSLGLPTRVLSRRFQTRPLGNMLQGCKAREALAKSDGASLGLWQTFPGANISRTLARSDGIDWVMVDCEHGNIDGKLSIARPLRPQSCHTTSLTRKRSDAAMHEAVPAIAACGVSPLVRLPDMQGWMIKRMLWSTMSRKCVSCDLTLSIFQAHLTRGLMGSVNNSP